MTEPDWNWGDTSGNSRSNQWNSYSSDNWNQGQDQSGGGFNYQNQGQTTPQNQGYNNYWNQQNLNAQDSFGSPPFAQQPSFNQTPFPGPQGGFGANNFMSDPMFSAAKQIGGQFAEQQKEKLSQYISSFNLKYYFAVDNTYVGKKIGILLFPFFHRDWSTQFGGDGKPVPAKLDINAPDLYVPLMAFITYILVSGFVFGVQRRFSPEQLGMQTTNALFYLFLENMIVMITKYILNISQSLSLWHTLAFSGYKFVGIVICLILYLFGGTTIYYWALIYMVVAITVFLARSLKSFVIDMQSSYADDGRKRKMYLLLSIVITQALIMYLLTSSVTSFMSDQYDFAKMAMSKIGMKSNNVPLMPNGEVDYEALLKMP